MKGKRAATNINKLISDFMIYSFAYYELGHSFISDNEFDILCDKIKENYNKINHPHKKLIKNLNSYSGYYLKGSYPTIVKVCALEMLKDTNKNATQLDRDKRHDDKSSLDKEHRSNGRRSYPRACIRKRRRRI